MPVVGILSLVAGPWSLADTPPVSDESCALATYDQQRVPDVRRLTLPLTVLDYLFHTGHPIRIMLLSKEYVGYLAREVTKKLIAGEFIETATVPAVTERVHAAMLEELSLEDRIHDEVRVILEAYSEEMRQSGANYQEMFRKVKSELVKKYKAVL
jgi:hypothetical protein